MTMLDAEPVVLEQEEIAVPCDMHDCEHEATWIYRWSCGCVDLLCDRCDDLIQSADALDPNPWWCDEGHECFTRLLIRERLKEGS